MTGCLQAQVKMRMSGAEQVQSLFDDADVEQVAQQTQAPKQIFIVRFLQSCPKLLIH